MRVTHVIPAIRDEASGPSYSVPALATSLGRRGVDVSMHVLAPQPTNQYSFRLKVHTWHGPNRLGWSPSMHSALVEDAQDSDLMHNHSLWMMPNVYPAWAVRRSKCRLMTSPRGTLSPAALRTSVWKKRAAWWLAQRAAVRTSGCLHATSQKEAQEIRATGLTAPIAIIPNGVDLPTLSDRPRPTMRRLLFIGRIHPLKGLGELLEAWRAVQTACEDWELHIVGPGAVGYVNSLKSRSLDLGCERVCWSDGAFGDQKVHTYQDAELFVLPTQTENFGMTVAEALACGLPAIVSNEAPWQALETNGCGWWIEPGISPLVECLRYAMDRPRRELSEMGERGRQMVAANYSWDDIAVQMHQTYKWMLDGGRPPAWVDCA